MIPRGAPYTGWRDLLAAAAYCVVPADRTRAARRVEELWAPNTVAFLSVRSGLDAILSALALPAGSEVIISAITIPHILDILAHHQLVAVPVDVDPESLAVESESVERAVTLRTRAVLLAHLFGSRMPLDKIVAIAKSRQLLVLEDAAQANDGSAYRGHDGADVTMFSFGPIKRQTAYGGGLFVFRNTGLLATMRTWQDRYPVQSARAYLRRVATLACVAATVTRPGYALFVAACRLTGRDHDKTFGAALRGFAKGDLFSRLRTRPSSALLRALHRRISQDPRPAIEARVAIVRTVSAEWPDIPRAGSNALHHSHWLFPVRVKNPTQLMHHLWRAGFDATRGASNLCCARAPADRPTPSAASRLMDEVLYLPHHPSMSDREARAMANAVRAFDERLT